MNNTPPVKLLVFLARQALTITRADACEQYGLVPVGAQDRDEGVLGYLDLADLLHFRFALLLFIEELVLARNIASIKLRGHIFSVWLDRRSRDDCAANDTLNRDLELVAGN